MKSYSLPGTVGFLAVANDEFGITLIQDDSSEMSRIVLSRHEAECLKDALPDLLIEAERQEKEKHNACAGEN